MSRSSRSTRSRWSATRPSCASRISTSPPSRACAASSCARFWMKLRRSTGSSPGTPHMLIPPSEGDMRDQPRTPSPSNPGAPQPSGAEWHRVTVAAGYIRAELFNRQTLEETQKFLDATVAAATRHGCPQLLICIRNSKPLFAVERYGFSAYLETARKMGYKIALVGSTRELRIAHQYYATLAQLRGVNLRAFPDEPDAVAWLTSDEDSSPSPERA